MPPTQASAKFASASSVSAQVQRRATAPRPTGKTVVRAGAAGAAGRAAAAAATRCATSARADSDDDDSAVFVDPRERKALALLQGLAAAIGGIAQADPAVAAAVQLPRGVTLLDVAVAVDAAVDRAVARVARPASPPVNDYYHCAYEYRPDCACKGCVAARGDASNSPRYAPSSPDVHDCDNADCPCVGCAAVRAQPPLHAHRPARRQRQPLLRPHLPELVLPDSESEPE